MLKVILDKWKVGLNVLLFILVFFYPNNLLLTEGDFAQVYGLYFFAFISLFNIYHVWRKGKGDADLAAQYKLYLWVFGISGFVVMVLGIYYGVINSIEGMKSAISCLTILLLYMGTSVYDLIKYIRGKQ